MEEFGEIVSQFENMIYSIIQKLRIYKNQEEFFQIGLIALWEAHKGFNSNLGKFSSYAYSYIIGRMMTQLTKEKLFENRNTVSHDTFDHISFFETKVLEEEILLSYCEHLTDKQKKWVILHFLHQLTINEIAEKEGVSESAVKGWRKGAIVKLKDNN